MRASDGFGHDAHRYLDGEPHGELTAKEQEQADRLAGAVRAYAAELEPPGDEIDDAVMEAVRSRTPGTRRSAWRWLVEPRQVSIRPVWATAAAAAAALVLWFGGQSLDRGPVADAAASVAADTVFVRFELMAPDARLVSLAGSFNEWEPGAVPLVRGEAGVWSTTLALPLGEHQYQFVVDGERWIPDPSAHAQVEDGFGGTNSLIVVGPKGVVRS
jgi:hypothetical protein